MIIRDVNGNIQIVNRKNYKNDELYYLKLFNMRMECKDKYSMIVNIPKELPTKFTDMIKYTPNK